MESLLCVANGPGAKLRGTTNGIRSEVRLSAGQRAVNGGSRRSPPDLLLQLLDALGDDAHELIDLVGGDGQRRGQAQRAAARVDDRSEEHTSELQSPCNLVCRLLLEKKKKKKKHTTFETTLTFCQYIK